MKRNTQIIRNIGIIAHVDAGKTTVSERILLFSGKIHKGGDVHHGNTTMDHRKTERDHGITVTSAATSVSWRDHQINLIDTPGHIDFNIDVRCALRVLDGAVVVFDAVAGVEPQTETNWRLADEYDVPRIAFVNKLDRAGADFERVCAMIRERLGVEPLVLQAPLSQIGQTSQKGLTLLDLVRGEAVSWPQEDGRTVERKPHGDHPARQRLTAQLADFDDEVATAYLAGLDVSAEALLRAIRQAVLGGAHVPVLCGSALKNKGVQPLLDAVVDLLPAPVETEEAFTALIFKTAADDSFGHLSYCRVYSGTLKPGQTIWNPREEKRERVSRIYLMHANSKQAVDTTQAGDIVALTGLKSAKTGDTLCEPGHDIVLERIETPEPVTSVVIEAENRAAREKLVTALGRLLREDPTLRLSTHPETGQMLLSGMGELHLQIAREELENAHGVTAQFGKPLVAYRETLTRVCEVKHHHKKQKGGQGQYADVTIQFEPLPAGSGVEFVSRITGGAIPTEFIGPVERGIREQAQTGILSGHPLVDFRATLIDGATHEKDSSALAFQIAGAAALREAVSKAAPVILEPVMAVSVTTPEEHLGSVIGDLSRRRGVVIGQDERGNAKLVEAEAPLAEMFGYINALRSLTSGRGDFVMELVRYAPVPSHEQTRLLAA